MSLGCPCASCRRSREYWAHLPGIAATFGATAAWSARIAAEERSIYAALALQGAFGRSLRPVAYPSYSLDAS